MQFKMAENSLFAILLRAPFWYSLVLALAIVILSAALFGMKASIFGIAAALPFFGIGIMAAWRQWHEPGEREIQELMDSVSGMAAKDFTRLVGDAYEKQGYEVEPFAGKAADLKLTRGWRIILVCTRRFKAARQGVEPLKELKQVSKEHEATGLVYVCLGQVTDNARKFAADNNIELVDAVKLAQLKSGRIRES